MNLPDGAVTDLLQQIERGDFLADADRKLADLIADLRSHAVDTNGKAKGAITITIGLALDGGYVKTAGVVKVKTPERATRETVLYLDKDGRIVGRDPRQPEFDIPAPRARLAKDA